MVVVVVVVTTVVRVTGAKENWPRELLGSNWPISTLPLSSMPSCWVCRESLERRDT